MTNATEGEVTWAKLRQRKVVQWGIAYAAGAWGFLQGLQYVSEAFAWPTQFRRVSIVALLIGLPITLVLAWYHGDKGQQRVTRTELAVLTLLFLFGGALFWRYEHAAQSPSTMASTSSTAPATAATAESRPSIAVLPFENRSKLDDDVFFVDGIHDDILTQLSKVSALKVISRTSVEQFRNTRLTAKVIADQLGVKNILEGGVQRAGDRVRINVQLIDATTDAHLWAENYDRELSTANIFAIQSEVASAIASALRTALTPAEKTRVATVPTQNLQAWEAYQLGQQRMSRRTSRSLQDATQFFRQAIALDPKFAAAYAELAQAMALQIDYGNAPRTETLASAEKLLNKALELDPSVAEAWAVTGMIGDYPGHCDRAEKALRRAIELRPSYALAHRWLGECLNDGRRTAEALREFELAVSLDPLSAINNTNLAGGLQAVGRFKDADAYYRKAISIDPDFAVAYLQFGFMNAFAMNRWVAAIDLLRAAVRIDPGNPGLAADHAYLYLNLGADERTRQILTAALSRWPDHEHLHAIAGTAYLTFGDFTGAIQHLRRALSSPGDRPYAMQCLGFALAASQHYEPALAAYRKEYPEFFGPKIPSVDASTAVVAYGLAPLLQQAGDKNRAADLLKEIERFDHERPRLGATGTGVDAAAILALRGQKAAALRALRAAEKAGWRGPEWRIVRDYDPAFASIRNDPEFKAIFADIERDMARQRAELAKRPKDAPLDLASLTQ